MKQVTKDMNIREMVLMDEGIAEILMNAGMHCLGCMMSHFENLEQACAVHGIDADALVDQINEYLRQRVRHDCAQTLFRSASCGMWVGLVALWHMGS